jgi:hypothetical protein
MDAPALAAAIGGSLVGALGILVGWLSSRGERSSALALAKAQREHEREIARGERLYEDRKNAYQGLLRQLHRTMLSVERTHPFLTVGEPLEPPEPPSEDEWTAMLVGVATFGSAELEEAYATFAAEVRSFQAHAWTFEATRNQRDDISETVTQMDAHRQGARDALKNIERLIRDELAAL